MPIVINGYEGAGSNTTVGDSQYVPILDSNNVFQEELGFTRTHGAHHVRFGAGLIRRQLNYHQNTNGLAYYNFTATTAGAPPEA